MNQTPTFDAGVSAPKLSVAVALVLVPLLAPAAPAAPNASDTGVVVESLNRSDAGTPAAKLSGKPKAVAGKPQIKSAMPKLQTSLSGLKLSMAGFKIEGDVLVSQEGLKQAMAPWADRELDFPEFEKAVHAIADYLRNNGHPNVKVRISRAAMQDGQMAVAIEGLTPRSEDYASAPAVTPRIQVKQFVVKGNTVLSAAEVQQLVSPWENKDLTVEEMQKPAEAIAAMIRQKGYPLAQAFLPPQRVDGGTLEIQVQEGVVEAVTVQGADKRIKPEIVTAVVANGAPTGKPLKGEALEQSLLVANEYPGVQVKAQLVPGSQPGTTVVQTQVEEGKLVTGSATLDNYGNKHSGDVRLSVAAALNSPSGHGETWSFNASASDGSSSGRIGVQAPVGTRGARLGGSYSVAKVDTKASVIPVNLDGSVEAGSLFGSYPIFRSATSNLFAVGAFDQKRMQHNIEGSNFSDRTVQMLTLGLSGDGLARLGSYNWGVSLAAGKTDLSDNLGNELRDAETTRTAGHFKKGLANVNGTGYLPAFGPSWSVYASLAGQWANKNLDNAEKFQLGGPNGVRAYPVGEGYGDTGLLASLELRRNLGSYRWGDLSLFGFWDYGRVTQYKRTWDGWTTTDLSNPNTYELQGFGLGLNLVKKDVGSLKVMFAQKLGDNPNPTITGKDNDGTNRSARIWIIGTVSF